MPATCVAFSLCGNRLVSLDFHRQYHEEASETALQLLSGTYGSDKAESSPEYSSALCRPLVDVMTQDSDGDSVLDVMLSMFGERASTHSAVEEEDDDEDNVEEDEDEGEGDHHEEGEEADSVREKRVTSVSTISPSEKPLARKKRGEVDRLGGDAKAAVLINAATNMGRSQPSLKGEEVDCKRGEAADRPTPHGPPSSANKTAVVSYAFLWSRLDIGGCNTSKIWNDMDAGGSKLCVTVTARA